MSDRRWDAHDKARMEALIASNGELQADLEHARHELQASRSRLSVLVAEHEAEQGRWAKERGGWVHDRIGLEGQLEEKDARIKALVEAYKDVSRLVEETRGQTALRPLLRERGWLIHALERLAGTELEWDAAGVAWLEVFGNRIAVTKKEYDAAKPADLAAEVDDLALDTARCPKGHLVNFRPAGRFPGRAPGEAASWAYCPVCGEKADNPIPSPEEIRDALTGLAEPARPQHRPLRRRASAGTLDAGAQA